MKNGDLLDEIQQIVQGRLERNEATESAWLVHSVVSAHPGIEGDDTDFFMLCAYEHVRQSVRAVLRRYKPTDAEPDPQMVLPGFKSLQKGYFVDRENRSMLVPVSGMTYQEFTEKAHQYRVMGAGCFQHARELERYRDSMAELA